MSQTNNVGPNFGQDLRHLEKDLRQVEEKTENLLNKVLSWGPWEMLTHLATAVLFVYVAYLLFTNPSQRTVTNWLLLLIAFAVAVQIHQNINLQKSLMST